MRKVLFGIIITLTLLLFFQYCQHQKEEQQTVFKGTQLIQEQLTNVGKLIVTEGHFSEVYNYADAKSSWGDLMTFEKKALVIINADVAVAYDLSKLTYEFDEDLKIIRITAIPDEEITINPKIEFYNIDQSVFNPFTGDDYNKIQEKVRVDFKEKIENSTITTNAKNRLISELSKFYIITNSMGWTLEYDESVDKKYKLTKGSVLLD
ncbi:DUF4230 domain-containing protein [Spongiivirga citrea]|uniref:DUF4230 domain-containing protein n=1 Tax=Spongiivirga citrea TaxID=1481457 RepID=A0A6M0CLC8_9FLAO|nr:DUF4230 domain-containing protein [Spongiivirga citrea]NER18728.1 DUF4230 domain-containing protein [Spongiivirga citrea]